MKRFLPASPVFLQAPVGVFFLFTAAVKASNPVKFAETIATYNILTDMRILIPLAVGVVLFEWLLGAALVFIHDHERLRKGILLTTLATFMVFTPFIIWGWLKEGIQDCGCFGGIIAMRPAISIGKNCILAALTLAAFIYPHRSTEKKPSNLIQRIALILISLLIPLSTFCIFVSPQPFAQ